MAGEQHRHPSGVLYGFGLLGPEEASPLGREDEKVLAVPEVLRFRGPFLPPLLLLRRQQDVGVAGENPAIDRQRVLACPEVSPVVEVVPVPEVASQLLEEAGRSLEPRM
jgi:hypothetical protein